MVMREREKGEREGERERESDMGCSGIKEKPETVKKDGVVVVEFRDT
jgi:hypothetical protein